MNTRRSGLFALLAAVVNLAAVTLELAFWLAVCVLFVGGFVMLVR